jgi:hypothetical protein
MFADPGDVASTGLSRSADKYRYAVWQGPGEAPWPVPAGDSAGRTGRMLQMQVR